MIKLLLSTVDIKYFDFGQYPEMRSDCTGLSTLNNSDVFKEYNIEY
jgi:hypothetical protein